MKKKTIHYPSLNIEIRKEGLNKKVRLIEGWFSRAWTLAEFYIPSESVMPEAEIIKTRAKHDFGITYDHYTLTLK